MTPNVHSIAADLISKFPVSIQTTNCRKIAGSNTWSQHAWANAGDVFGTTEVLNEVHSYLQSQYSWIIRVLLWQVADHFDHIHFDPWPKGISDPPCAGGSLEVRNQDGTVGDHFTSDIMTPEQEAKLDLVLDVLLSPSGKIPLGSTDGPTPREAWLAAYQRSSAEIAEAVVDLLAERLED